MEVPKALFLEYMQVLDFKPNLEGVCFGIAGMAIQAYLQGKFNTFLQRMALLNQYIDAQVSANDF